MMIKATLFDVLSEAGPVTGEFIAFSPIVSGTALGPSSGGVGAPSHSRGLFKLPPENIQHHSGHKTLTPEDADRTFVDTFLNPMVLKLNSRSD